MRKLIPILLLLCALPARAAITLNATRLPASKSGANLSFTITATAGNAIAVGIVLDSGSTLSGCKAGSTSLTLSTTHSTDTNNGSSTYACYTSGTIASGQTSISFTNTSGGMEIVAYDLSVSSGLALDGSPVAYSSQSGDWSATAPQITTTAAGFVAAVAPSNGAAGSVASPWTYDAFDEADCNAQCQASHYVTPSAGTYTANWHGGSTCSFWSALIFAFTDSGGGGGTTARPTQMMQGVG